MNEEEMWAIEYLSKYVEYCLLCKERLFQEHHYKSIQTIINLVKKQQKETEARLEEIDSLYKMMSVKDDEIEKLKDELKELQHFKEEVIDIIKYADDTAEPTYWNIRKLLGLGD